jgi:hypothetical protein
MSEKQPSITVRVWGGLGNRLFMIACASGVARRMEGRLVIQSSNGQHLTEVLGGFEPSSVFAGIREFECQPTASYLTGLRPNRARRLANRVLAIRRRIAVTGPQRSFPVSGGSLWTEENGGIFLEGYFQSCRWVDQAASAGAWPHTCPSVERPTDWYLELSHLIQVEGPLAIHVRLGDYRTPDHRRRLGTPDPHYYVEGVRRLHERRDELQDRPIWLFSDEPDPAAQTLRAYGLRPDRIVRSPVDSSPAEGIALLARVGGLVMSNSTFSWWGAYWNAHSESIVAPDPWHNVSQGEDMFRRAWLKVPKVGNK